MVISPTTNGFQILMPPQSRSPGASAEFTLALTAYDLMRLPKLMAATA